jgi:hypothetical protein
MVERMNKHPAFVEHSLEDDSPQETSVVVEWQRLSEHKWGCLFMRFLFNGSGGKIHSGLASG